MKKIIFIALLSIVTTVVIMLIVFEIKAQRDQLLADKIEEIDSDILSESRKLLVHLPKDYMIDVDRSYPVLFALDATSHDHDVMNAATILRAAESLADLIVVGVVNTDRKKDLTPNYIMKDDDPSELGHGSAFLDFLEKEAIPLIEQNYRTSGYRMISGNSRGGLFAFFSMLEKPNLFDAYFCYSPAFWRNENIIAEKAETFFSEQNQLNEFLYLSLGSDENDKMKRGFDLVVNRIEENDSIGIQSHYNYTQNANHSTNAYYSIPIALRRWNERQ